MTVGVSENWGVGRRGQGLAALLPSGFSLSPCLPLADLKSKLCRCLSGVTKVGLTQDKRSGSSLVLVQFFL